jgi:hypothetical protein
VVVVVVDVEVVPAGVLDVVVGASPMTESTLPKPKLEARLSTSMMRPSATVVSPPVTGARPEGKGDPFTVEGDWFKTPSERDVGGACLAVE